eukprot:GSChrysophyteH2.ASY1.ANO1.1287.1 assembled CDS
MSSASPSTEEDFLAHADAFKAEGNAAFQSGKVDDAIRLYSQAIDLHPDGHVLHSNRSAAHMKASNISKALKDAERCIELQPSWAKGYSRLGAAQQGLKRFEKAIETYKNGLKLEPENSSLKDALHNCLEAQEVDKQNRHKKAAEERRIEEEPVGVAGADTLGSASSTSTSGPTQGDNADNDDESDLLGGFFDSVEEAVQEEGKKEAEEKRSTKKGEYNEKYLQQELGTGMEQYTRLTAKNYEFRNLNPFTVLQLGTDATEEDIKQRYRKLSSRVHPDKLRGVDNARVAFEQVNAAYRRLQDEGQRNVLVKNIETIRADIKRTYKAETSNGVSLEECCVKGTMKHFADVEMARRRSEQLQRSYLAREKQQAQDEKDQMRHEAEQEKTWVANGRAEKRQSNWQDFKGSYSKRTKKN